MELDLPWQFKTLHLGLPRLAQWWKIHLPVQETWVWSLVWEDPTCCRATNPMCHNYWADALEPARHNYRAHTRQLLKPVCSRAHAQPEKKPLEGEPRARQQRPSTAKTKNVLKKKKRIKKQCLTSSIILSHGQKPPLISSYLIDVCYNKNQAKNMKVYWKKYISVTSSIAIRIIIKIRLLQC